MFVKRESGLLENIEWNEMKYCKPMVLIKLGVNTFVRFYRFDVIGPFRPHCAESD